MNERVWAGALAVAGAVALAVGCWLPYQRAGTSNYEIFQRHGQPGVIYFAVEPAVVIVVALTIGILLLRGPLSIAAAAVLVSVGVQTALMWVGYLGYGLNSNFGDGQGPHMKAGGWIGIAGALVIAVGGVLAYLAAATASGTAAPAGWYPDAHDPALQRYWSGSRWTDHTADR
jgi:uncharacterized protein DUF2510